VLPLEERQVQMLDLLVFVLLTTTAFGLLVAVKNGAL
jgi:hypothetical protein